MAATNGLRSPAPTILPISISWLRLGLTRKKAF
jgi:hypothetical protein